MRRFVFSGALVFSLSSAASADEARPMTLAACIQEALQRNPDVITADDEHAVARAERWETAGQMGPRFHVDASLQQWGSSYGIDFGGQTFTLHDPFTWAFTASVIQPITPLLPLLDQYHVRDLGVDIASIRRDATRRDTAFRVLEAYYRLLEASRLAEVATQSVDQLTLQLKQANSFHDAGTISRDQVLRAELALANAKQRLIQTRAQVTLGRARLAQTMGMPIASAIDAIPLTGEPTFTVDVTLANASSAAHSQRVELRELDNRIEQSRASSRVAWYKLFPQVNLIGSYMHNDQVRTGIQFVEKDAVFVGGALSWDVWDWGSTISGIHSADAKLHEARTARDKMIEQIDLEVHEAFLNVATAMDAIGVAKTAVASAEENYRLVNKRYDANSATQFDVVDAESLLTQARAQLQTSTYDYLIARAALRRAMGEMPDTRQP
jgi:outer membrane protein TolC